MEEKRNIFDFMRFAAATMVIWGHAYELNAIPGVPVLFNASIHSLGVIFFFTISGYLVTQSLVRSKSFAEFFWKRALRILPALALCTALTAIAIGPMVTAVSSTEYWSSPILRNFFYNAVLYIHYALPGLFQQNHLTAVNGSLWSLPVEALCYIVLGTLGTLFLWTGSRLAFVIVAVAALSGAMFFRSYSGPPILFYHMSLAQVFLVVPYFFVASAMAMTMKREHFRPMPALWCLIVLALVVRSKTDTLLVVIQPVLLSYAVLTIGLASVPLLREWHKAGDASYGMYLYAFPLQQILAQFVGNSVDIHSSILIGFVLSVLCGYTSWHLIEKHAITLKGALREAGRTDHDRFGEHASGIGSKADA